MMLCIKEITFYDYLFNFTVKLPPLGLYNVRHSQINEGVILGAFVDERLAGIAVIEFAHNPLLTYMFVTESYRGRGIGVQLVTAALSHVKDKSLLNLHTYLLLQNENAETFDHILKKTGFAGYDTATIIRYANDENCGRGWSSFMKKRGRRICDILEGRGFKTLSFNEASMQTFDKLKSSLGTQFPANLDPFNYIYNQVDRLVPDYSFITLKNDEPVAFGTVTTADDKSLVHQQTSTAFRYQGSGVFFLPLAAFMDRFLTGDNYNKASAMIFDSNDKMQRLVRSFIGPLAKSIKKQKFYRAKTGKDDGAA